MNETGFRFGGNGGPGVRQAVLRAVAVPLSAAVNQTIVGQAVVELASGQPSEPAGEPGSTPTTWLSPALAFGTPATS